jgi:hypothetical protein
VAMTRTGRKTTRKSPKIPVYIRIPERTAGILLAAAVFLISFVYFYGFCDYAFFYQENLKLLVYSSQYLHEYLVKPGGLLDLAGNFLAQGYFSLLYGSLVISLVNALFVTICLRIGRKLSPGNPFSAFLALVPVCLLLLFQTNFNWPMKDNIGFLLTAAYFNYTIVSGKRNRRLAALLIFPLFYYIAGAFAWIFLVMKLVQSLVCYRGPMRYTHPAAFLAFAAASFLISREFLFLQPDLGLLIFPFSLKDNFSHTAVLFILIGYMVAWPGLSAAADSLVRTEGKTQPGIPVTALSAVLLLSVVLLWKWYNPNIRRLFQVEKYAYARDWDALVDYQEAYQIPNAVAEYYYNVALSEKGQLCDRMFHGRQDYGTKALIIPWDSKAGVNNISRGVYFYYAVGLINEAHRWAYESMVAQGFRPENLKMLIKTNLINGHDVIAAKYIRILKKTLHYRKWAEKYEAMLFRPDRVRTDSELGEKVRLIPGKDFSIRIRNPQTNLLPLLEANPENKKAFEYLEAWHLLEKNIGAFADAAGRMKDMHYSRIPRHIEEALLIYNMGTGMMPDLGGLRISRETLERFRAYQQQTDPYLGMKIPDRSAVGRSSTETYWFYFEFK